MSSDRRSAGVRGPLKFRVLPERFAIHRLVPDQTIDWQSVQSASWFSVTRTPDELSLVVPESVDIGPSVRKGGWACLKIDQILDFALTGILADVSRVLADAGISIFAISTYDTDYLLISSDDLSRAVEVLVAAGHDVANPVPPGMSDS